MTDRAALRRMPMTFGISLLLHALVIGGLLIAHAADEREHLDCPPRHDLPHRDLGQRLS